MTSPGTLAITVDGKRWEQADSLDACGSDERCYVLEIDDSGAATIKFGDGATGARLPIGSNIVASYRPGSGQSQHTADVAEDISVTLIELLAHIGDVLSYYQDRVASEAYLETAKGRMSLSDLSAIADKIADHLDDVEVRIHLHPLDRRGEELASIEFTDSMTGPRPSTEGANTQARYLPGGGQAGHAASRTLETSLDLLAQEADEVAEDLDRLYADVYIETGGGWVAVADAADLKLAIAERADVCVCFRSGWVDPRDDATAPPPNGRSSATGRLRDSGQTPTA